MMEVYALYRDVISHGLMADLSEKSSRVYKMAWKLDEVQEKLSYIEDALGFLVKGITKISGEGGMQGLPPGFGCDKFYGKNGHQPYKPMTENMQMTSGIVIHPNQEMPKNRGHVPGGNLMN